MEAFAIFLLHDEDPPAPGADESEWPDVPSENVGTQDREDDSADEEDSDEVGTQDREDDSADEEDSDDVGTQDREDDSADEENSGEVGPDGFTDSIYYDHTWRHTQTPHLDHVDDVLEINFWNEMFFTGFDWLYGPGNPHHYSTNAQLYADPKVQNRMQEIASMRKGGNMPLEARPKRHCHVPLFTDPDGEEYQVTFGSGFPFVALPTISCPSLDIPWHSTALCLWQLRSRIPVSRSQTIPLPTYVMPWGKLFVRTSKRHPPVAEETDYVVVVDVESEDLPVWILAPRLQLRERIDGRARAWTALPIFDGLMQEGDEPVNDYYDAACILRSVRQLGAQPTDVNAPRYEESCILVRLSRAIIDPALVELPKERLLEFVSEDSISTDWWKTYGINDTE